MDIRLINSMQAFYSAQGKDIPSAEIAEGTIDMWMKGEGELDADMIAQDPELWRPVSDAYFSFHPTVPAQPAE